MAVEKGKGIDKGRIVGLVGFWAFIVGLVISVVAGLVLPGNGVVVLILVILGIIIGFLNIHPRKAGAAAGCNRFDRLCRKCVRAAEIPRH